MIKYIDDEQKSIIKIALIIVLIITCAVIIIFILNKNNLESNGQFIIPEIETNATMGKPNDIPKEYMYQEVKVNDNYIVYLCAIPQVKDNNLTIYFTSTEKNEGLVKIKVFNSNNSLIGESGLINPNSYIKDIKLNKTLNNNDSITVKVMHYEKETYYSLGEVKLDLLVKKID